MHFLFGSISVVNALGIQYFYYYQRTIHIVIVDQLADVTIWALSVLIFSVLASTCVRHERRAFQLVLRGFAILFSIALLVIQATGFSDVKVVFALYVFATAEFALLVLSKRAEPIGVRAAVYLLSSLAALEASSAIHYIVGAFDLTTSIGNVDAGIELQLSYLTYALLPWLYIAFIFAWAWAPLIRRTPAWNMLFKPFSRQSESPQVISSSSPAQRLSHLLDYRIFIGLAFIIFIGYYPYFHNPPWLVGTDALRQYYLPLTRVDTEGVHGLLGERYPLLLAILYLSQLTFHITAFAAVKLLPVFLVGALALSTTWLLARKESNEFRGIAFTLSILSVTTTIGIYSSTLSNWAALVAWSFFFAYLVFAVERGVTKWDFLVLMLISILIVYLHPWTWVMFAVSITLAAVITLLRDRKGGLLPAAMLGAIIGTGGFLGLISLRLLSHTFYANPPELYLSVIENPRRILLFWEALNSLTQVWAPSLSPLYIVVSILGVLYLEAADPSFIRRRLIIAWLCTAAIASFLVAPVDFNPAQPGALGDGQLWRVLFLTPFQVVAPFGVAWLTQIPYRLKYTNWDANPRINIACYALPTLVLSIGGLLAWASQPIRLILIPITLPLVTGIALDFGRGAESKVMARLILMILLLIAFNYATRALSQLLIAPHNGP